MYIYITAICGRAHAKSGVSSRDLSFVAYMMKEQGENSMKGIKEGKNDGERNVFNILERKE